MRSFIITAALAASFGVLAGGAPAERGSHTVCVGKGPGCLATIQAGLHAAHDGDTITIEAGTFDGGVRIGKSVKIVGAGAAATIVKGGGPVVTIGSHTAPHALTVSLAGVTITGGVSKANPSGRCGADVPDCGPGYPRATALAGGIEIAPLAKVTISNSVISANRTTPTVTVPSVTATTCPGGPCPFAYAGGGGIDNWGALTLVDTTVRDNVAGGGITAQADGGGILNEDGGVLKVVNSTLKGNRATVSAPNGRFGQGGGIYDLSNRSLDIRGSAVSGNFAVASVAMPPSVEVSASCAGICVGENTIASIRGTVISGNVVSGGNTRGDGTWCGGGVATDGGGSFVLADSTVSNNRVTATARSTSSKVGTFLACSGAIDVFAARVSISNSRIVGNIISVRTKSGAALAVAGAVSLVSANAVITNTVFRGNSATASSIRGRAVAYGGAIANGNVLTLRRSNVTGNSVHARSRKRTAHGGGIYNGPIPDLETVGHVMLVKSVVSRNKPDQCFACR